MRVLKVRGWGIGGRNFVEIVLQYLCACQHCKVGVLFLFLILKKMENAKQNFPRNIRSGPRSLQKQKLTPYSKDWSRLIGSTISFSGCNE